MDAPKAIKLKTREKITKKLLFGVLFGLVIIITIVVLGVMYYNQQAAEKAKAAAANNIDPSNNNAIQKYVSTQEADPSDSFAAFQNKAQQKLNQDGVKSPTTNVPPIGNISSNGSVNPNGAANINQAINQPAGNSQQSMVPPITAAGMVPPTMAQTQDDKKQRLEQAKQSPLEAPTSGDNSGGGQAVGSTSAQPNAEQSGSKKNSSDGSADEELGLVATGSKKNFLEAAKSSDAGYIQSKRLALKSPYTLAAGAMIPARLIQKINSDLPGNFRAMVRRDIYDSTYHRYLLIPAGSKLVGTYDSNVTYGEQRVMVAFTELQFPDGSRMDLKGQPGTDLDGASGFQDQVDNKYWQLFGSSFVMGSITGLMQLSQNNTNANVQAGGLGVTTNTNPSVGQTMAGSLGQQLGSTGLAVTQKNLSVAPTLIIRPGYDFEVQLRAALIIPPHAEQDNG